MKAKILEMYLDFVNNFITLGGFAERYEMDEDKAWRVLLIGAGINARLKKRKEKK